MTIFQGLDNLPEKTRRSLRSCKTIDSLVTQLRDCGQYDLADKINKAAQTIKAGRNAHRNPDSSAMGFVGSVGRWSGIEPITAWKDLGFILYAQILENEQAERNEARLVPDDRLDAVR